MQQMTTIDNYQQRGWSQDKKKGASAVSGFYFLRFLTVSTVLFFMRSSITQISSNNIFWWFSHTTITSTYYIVYILYTILPATPHLHTSSRKHAIAPKNIRNWKSLQADTTKELRGRVEGSLEDSWGEIQVSLGQVYRPLSFSFHFPFFFTIRLLLRVFPPFLLRLRNIPLVFYKAIFSFLVCVFFFFF